MPWIEKKLRGAKVLARCDASGALRVEDARVEIRYKPKDGRAYRASPRNLKDVPDARLFEDEHCAEAAPAPARGGGAKKSKARPRKKDATPPPHEDGAVIVYADGACRGNPGPSGLGVVIQDGERSRELSEYLGRGTNNIAELTAILRAATELAGRTEPIRIYTDSQYSIGVLRKGWKAKKNKELVAATKAALEALDDVALYYVPGHAGHALNEHADQLATEAADNRRSRGWDDIPAPGA
ncbi:MAG TPA: ribonuclease H [Sandaracinaceae bacterium LLY-WYZ-13_1]|nr:ribonuclease H [Sandaracinaceae bacterium LLY-WYZ-13_1]